METKGESCRLSDANARTARATAKRSAAGPIEATTKHVDWANTTR
jgi:hypothetical protein